MKKNRKKKPRIASGIRDGMFQRWGNAPTGFRHRTERRADDARRKREEME